MIDLGNEVELKLKKALKTNSHKTEIASVRVDQDGINFITMLVNSGYKITV